MVPPSPSPFPNECWSSARSSLAARRSSSISSCIEEILLEDVTVAPVVFQFLLLNRTCCHMNSLTYFDALGVFRANPYRRHEPVGCGVCLADPIDYFGGLGRVFELDADRA